MSQMLREYAEAGYALTPLRHDATGGPGKKPFKRGWEKTPYLPPEQLNPKLFQGYNWGVVLQDDDLVIDVDRRNFAEGDNPFERLVKSCPEAQRSVLLQTCYVMTGGRFKDKPGYHIYLKKPSGVKVRAKHPDYRGLDFLSAGHQVVGAGSTHPETKFQYQIVGGRSLKVILPAPEWLLETIRLDTTYLIPPQPDGTVEMDKAQDIARFSEWLRSNAPVAVEGESGDVTTFRVACRARDFALSPAKAYELMLEWNDRCQPPWDAEELQQKISNAYRYNQDKTGARTTTMPAVPEEDRIPALSTDAKNIVELQRWDLKSIGDKKLLLKTLNNTVNMFMMPDYGLQGLVAFNEFTFSIEFMRKAPWHRDENSTVWTEEDTANCRYYMGRHYFYEPAPSMIIEAVQVAASKFSYHPVRAYLDGLVWDQTPRLDTWLTTYAGAHNCLYTRAVASKILCAACARVYRPGCKFDFVPILEGPQGVGKSTLLSVLGGAWFSDAKLDIMTNMKDTCDAMRGRWFIEIAEMEAIHRNEASSLKAFVSKQSDRYRPAYARLTVDFPRQSVFVGTINPDSDYTYLIDKTGNRRFWPIRTGMLDIEALRRDRDQLFAEARDRFQSGETLYMDTPELRSYAASETKMRTIGEVWTPTIERWLLDEFGGAAYQTVTVVEVFTQALSGIVRAMSNLDRIKISNALMDLGWKKSTGERPETGTRANHWVRPDSMWTTQCGNRKKTELIVHNTEPTAHNEVNLNDFDF